MGYNSGTSAAQPFVLQATGGDVGIGSATPTAALYVVGNQNITGTVTGAGGSGNNAGAFYTGGNTVASFVNAVTINSGVTNAAVVEIGSLNRDILSSVAANVTYKYALAYHTNTTGGDFEIKAITSGASYNLDGTPVSRMYITASGNIGMGTIRPQYNLDVSGTGRFTSDVSINGNLIIGGALSVQQMQSKNVINTTTTNYQLIVSEDLSLNGRLLVSGDVSLGGRLYVPSNSSLIIGGVPFSGGTVFTGGSVANDISLNTRLFVGGDVSLNSRVFISGDVSMGGRLLISGDVSMGGRLLISGDVSLPSLKSYLSPVDSINTSSSWTSYASRNTGNYTGPAVSSTGQYQTVSSSANVLYSSNYGQTWANATVNTGPAAFGCTAISADGKYLIGLACPGNGKIFYSSDFGQTWNGSNLTLDYYGNSLAMSATGQYCVIGKYTSGPVLVYYSSNYGQTWATTATAPSSTGGIRTSAISGDGTRLLVGNGGYGGVGAASGIWYSSNAGSTWTQANLTNVTMIDIKMSYTGQYCIASKDNGIYYSSNYGVTWTLSTSSPINSALALDSRGQYGLATAGFENGSAGVYYTTNYGQTWTLSNRTTGNFHVALSSNGLYGIIASSNSNTGIYQQTNQLITSFNAITDVSGALRVADQIQLSYSTLPTFTTTSIGYVYNYTFPTNAVSGTNTFTISVPKGIYIATAYYELGSNQNNGFYIEITIAGTRQAVAVCPPFGGSNLYQYQTAISTIASCTASSTAINLVASQSSAASIVASSNFKVVRIA
jgi:hypothetical protein